jgi:hypothetical protein
MIEAQAWRKQNGFSDNGLLYLSKKKKLQRNKVKAVIYLLLINKHPICHVI